MILSMEFLCGFGWLISQKEKAFGLAQKRVLSKARKTYLQVRLRRTPKLPSCPFGPSW
jgi:hypothetical protein